MPDITTYDPESVYIQWELTLTNESVSEDAIKEVFEWIDGDGAEIIISQSSSAPAAETKVEAASSAVVEEKAVKQPEVKETEKFWMGIAIRRRRVSVSEKKTNYSYEQLTFLLNMRERERERE